MKAASLLWVLCLPLAAGAAEVKVGNTLAEVREMLGSPRGQIQVGPRQILHYDRGEVELRSGAVIRVALLTPAEFAARESRLAALAAQRDEENSRRHAQGEALMARKLADPAFLAAPLAYQLSFWRKFAMRYPGVPVSEQLAILRMRVAEQVAQREAQTARIAELEDRLSRAEARADEAESRHYYFGAYGYDDGYRNRHPFTLWPVAYHFDNTPQPIITPFNPSVVPLTYDQKLRASAGQDNSYDSDRRDGRGYGRRGRM